ncbi:MAG: hypothetical protein ABSE63_07840 [Thermoguttaceae bacterium]
MRDLTVDTEILIIASGISDHGSQVDCIKLLNQMMEIVDVYLVLDKIGTIEQEYKNKMNEVTFGMIFVRYMWDKLKINSVDRAKGPEWKPINTKLDEVHFHPNDRKFIQAAMKSNSKRIVAQEDDYSDEVRDILRQKRLKITVDSAKSACNFICANQ